MQRQEGERHRLAEREKRKAWSKKQVLTYHDHFQNFQLSSISFRSAWGKALWNTGVPGAADCEREGRLTANGWESSHFQSNKARFAFGMLVCESFAGITSSFSTVKNSGRTG